MMSTRLSLTQLNIEHDKHLDTVTTFLAAQKTDVTCIQELLQSHIPLLEEALGAECYFVPTTRILINGSEVSEGVGIFSRYPLLKTGAEYYHGEGLPPACIDETSLETKYRTQSRALAWCDIEKEGVVFKIAATHFTWTPDGHPNETQQKDVSALLHAIDTQGELVVCGDFNAPRGGEIFSIIAGQLTDNIPLEYTTSIDGSLHRMGPMDLMVDGIFSTKNYRISEVRRFTGVSDHCAFTALVENLTRQRIK